MRRWEIESPELPVPTTFPTVTYRIAPTGTFQPRFLAPSCSLRRPNGDKGAPQLRQAASTSKNGENDGKMMMNYGSWGYLGVPYLQTNWLNPFLNSIPNSPKIFNPLNETLLEWIGFMIWAPHLSHHLSWCSSTPGWRPWQRCQRWPKQRETTPPDGTGHPASASQASQSSGPWQTEAAGIAGWGWWWKLAKLFSPEKWVKFSGRVQKAEISARCCRL